MATIQQHKAAATLNKVFSFEEGVMSRGEWVKLKKDQGATVEVRRVRNEAAESKLADSIQARTWHIPFGNERHPKTIEWKADKETLKTGIFKTVYSLRDIDGKTNWVITKTEFDYFNTI